MQAQVLHDFRPTRPQHEIAQGTALERIRDAHVGAEQALHPGEDVSDFARRMDKLVRRCACSASQIRTRGHVLEDTEEIYDVGEHPHGKGTLARMAVYERTVADYFERAFDDGASPPDDIVHVTCTGYVSPSGAQRLVSRRKWGERTRVTHAYHMGCYASIPALRIAAGCLRDGSSRVDVVHTELCTLHLDPARHEAEQIVVQSLFADGFIRYAVSAEAARGLEVLATDEQIVPDSEDSMRWLISEWGLQMTLARDVPEKVGGVLRPFVARLFERAKIGMGDLASTQFAIHPGGPRIIDGVRATLELDESQVAISRDVLRDYGNMSSATLPHVWHRMLESASIARGTTIVSLAFGPGITVCGAVFRKR